MNKQLLKASLAVLLMFPFTTLFGQSQSDFHPDSLLLLQEIIIKSKQFRDSSSNISAKRMEEFNRLDAGRALNILPGITLSNIGARNESGVFVRGFDLRQVPVFIDGIPVYVPYDGYADLGRFTTFDLAEINVAKGFSSVLYGANAMGGAINLVSRRPVNKFEINGATGYLTGGYRSNINIGSNLGKIFIQGSISQINRDYYNLSQSFDSVAHENGGRRDNSYSKDTKYSIKVGFTPSKKQEYVINYINQQGEKGTPVYAGADTKNSLLSKPRYWQWPYWNKESFYFLSNTTLNANSYVRVRLYYDKFKNLLSSFDDVSYTGISKPYAFKSYYNDDTYGGSAELGTRKINKNDIKLAVHFKRDRHKEYNAGEPVRTFEDNTFSAGIEDIYQPIARLKIVPGVSFNARQSAKAQNYNGTTKEISNFAGNGNSAWNYQIGAFYSLSETGLLNFTVARKTRFATVKDRYSYRMGTAIPNPDLKSESALNYEVSYSEIFLKKLKFQASLFYSKLNNTIQSVSNVQPGLSQLQNTGIAEFYGLEGSLDCSLLKGLNSGVNYTYIERHNLSKSEIKFTDVPAHKLIGYIRYSPLKNSYIIASAEYNTKRYSTTYGAYVGGFMVVNTKASFKIWKWLGVEGGINNILDRNYSLSEGYPEQGRNYFINFIYSNF